MSGLEVAGVILGSFPLIISSLENWNSIARIGGYFWKIRREYDKCWNDARYYQLVYRNNLEDLLLPTILDKSAIEDLMKDPGGDKWKSDHTLQTKLEDRLRGSYHVYEDVLMRMNEITKELARELSFDKDAIQERLSSRDGAQQSPKSTKRPSRDTFTQKNFDFQVFRVKFSLREPNRDQLFAQLKEYNERLQELVTSSDKLRANQSTVHSSTGSRAMELTLNKIWKSSDLLFGALQHAWQCSCIKSHVANLRMERQTAQDICFELVLMFTSPSEQRDDSVWSWQEVKCGEMPHCVHPYDVSCRPAQRASHPNATNASKLSTAHQTQTVAQKRPSIRFADTPNTIRLCEGLVDDAQKDCMGVIAHDDVSYYVHPFVRRTRHGRPVRVTLDHVLSDAWTAVVSRPQRFKIAHLVASAVAQLTFTPWLRTKLEKNDIVFFLGDNAATSVQLDEPFIYQVFHNANATQAPSDASDFTINFLGVLLVELCFGERLEDCRMRKKYPPGDAETKWYMDLRAAKEWSQSVPGEAGEDYASAVQWCLDSTGHVGKNWRSDIHFNVIQPLERCLAYFKMTGVADA
jgi:hypothetical protein